MQELIPAFHAAFHGSRDIYFWLVFYFGLGFSLFSVLVSLIYFSSLIKDRVNNRELPSHYGHFLTFGFSLLSMGGGFAIGSVMRALVLGHVDVPEIAAFAFVAGGVLQVGVHIALNRKRVSSDEQSGSN
jgi:hypothetical protein